ncbi:hypothetical protein NE237_031830 [Protea cynaroides]|uniref:Uncharacterized protein n=1 Tax=Protea cynaroides TaxID=273540 RepID=A0A9Q0L1Y3_9MAGN|nr:hypothetical protein NE237_031830 [Protea cynaroides]
MNVHQEVDTYFQFKADANIGGRQRVQITSIVREPTEGPYLMDLQDTSILDAILFSVPYAINSPLVQYFSSYASELILEKDLFDLCFDKSNGFNQFPSIWEFLVLKYDFLF